MSRPNVHFEPQQDAELPVGSAVVLLRGIVDLQARPYLAEAATCLVMAQPRAVCVDLSATTYFGTDGLRFLANLTRCQSEPACAVTVARPSPMARRALEVTGFAAMLQMTAEPCTIFDTAATANSPVVSVLLSRDLAAALPVRGIATGR